jgi:hypothetical protein
MPLALVEAELNFDENPRLETAVGFLLLAAVGHKPRKTMIKRKSKIKNVIAAASAFSS